jgi:Carboxysome shell peptide mid-region
MGNVMSGSSNSLNVQTGRNASRMRRAQLVSGKAGMPLAKERVRVGRPNGRKTTVSADALPSETASLAASESKLSVATTEEKSNQQVVTGRDASRARREGLIQGKQGILKPKTSESTTSSASSDIPAVPVMVNEGRLAAKALRNLHESRGQTKDTTNTPSSGRSRRNTDPAQYPPKVTESKSYAGHKVTGVRIGQKENVTGNERGAALPVTGNQYIGRESGYNPREGGIKVGASKTPAGQVMTGSQVRSKINITGDESNPALRISGDSDQELVDDLSQRSEQGSYSQMQFPRQNNQHGHTVFGATTWGDQHVTGLDIEHNLRVTGDEQGLCDAITGTPYVGPNQFQTSCSAENEEKTERRISPKLASANFISGDVLSSADHVTGTQRGSEHNITGTPYYKADPEGDEKMDVMERIKKINNSFSVRIPQRESQERVGTDAVNAPTAESLITGTFSAGEGKITGNQEFRFNPRPKVETIADKSRVTGEGRVEGKTITGSAWISKNNVTGTEGYIAAERNPSQRKGDPHGWAGARKFKDKGGTRPEPTHHVTGMVGWSPKASVPITVSGGGQG